MINEFKVFIKNKATARENKLEIMLYIILQVKKQIFYYGIYVRNERIE